MALPKETGSQRIGRAYGTQRQSSTLPVEGDKVTLTLQCRRVTSTSARVPPQR